jgi:hypothetical protein
VAVYALSEPPPADLGAIQSERDGRAKDGVGDDCDRRLVFLPSDGHRKDRMLFLLLLLMLLTLLLLVLLLPTFDREDLPGGLSTSRRLLISTASLDLHLTSMSTI